MKCPHCHKAIHEEFLGASAYQAGGFHWQLSYMTCPACSKAIVRVLQFNLGGGLKQTIPAFPSTDSMRPVPPEVPDPYKQDFVEACAVLSLSPMASAALSRRNLQAILRDKANTTKKDLVRSNRRSHRVK